MESAQTADLKLGKNCQIAKRIQEAFQDYLAHVRSHGDSSLQIR